MRVGLRRQGRTVTSARKLFLDTVRRGRSFAMSRRPRSHPTARAARITRSLRFVGPTRRPRCSSIAPTCATPRLVAARAIPRGKSTARWDGRARSGGARADGRLPAGGPGSGRGRQRRPAALPPPRKAVRGHPGVAVRYLRRRGRAAGGGRRCHPIQGVADGRRYRWRVRRLGSRRRSRAGPRAPPTWRCARLGPGRASRSCPSGSARTGTRRRSRARPQTRAACSSCCPRRHGRRAIRWRPNGDGYPDVLPRDRASGLDARSPGAACRPASCPTSPACWVPRRRAVALRAHDRSRARRSGTSRSTATRAFCSRALPASRPTPRPAAARLRASRRPRGLGRHGRLRPILPSLRRTCSNAAGAASAGALRRARSGSSPRRSAGRAERPDRLLRRGPRPVRPVRRWRSRRGCRRARACLHRRDREPERPSLVVYRAGGGIVARIGIDGFGHALRTSPVAQRIMRRLWVLLSR